MMVIIFYDAYQMKAEFQANADNLVKKNNNLKMKVNHHDEVISIAKIICYDKLL